MAILHYYQLTRNSQKLNESKLKSLLGEKLTQFSAEVCYNVNIEESSLKPDQERILKWILMLFEEEGELHLENSKLVESEDKNTTVIEIGPRLNQRTPFCTNALSICQNVGLLLVKGIEVSFRYKITCVDLKLHENEIVGVLHDSMTQCRYEKPLERLACVAERKPWFEIDVITGKGKALQAASDELGLAFDDWDVQFYANLFRNELGRNPTSVECFDLAQSNSEHSRHWFFKAKIVIDGEKQPRSLFQMVTDTLKQSNPNNVVAFRDNGSVIRGHDIDLLCPSEPGKPSLLTKFSKLQHITLTAETHNFPTGVAPFPGAATGTGGRQRDQHAIGRGSHVIAGTAGYCVGNLNLPDSPLAWEDGGAWPSCGNLAAAAKIIIDASNGASNYGNQFGEPLITGFFRSFGAKLGDERFEWLKPIMFSGGVGTISDVHVKKIQLEKDTKDLLVAKIGGPAYRIGVGGGSASSLMHGENDASRDFNAVQRGDAEMQQKLQRAIRACVELDDKNPILSIHDQGAGGNGNVLKEIVEPSGAVIYTKRFSLGDETLNSLELWTAEYQESDAILIAKEGLATIEKICERERCPLDVVGELNGSGRVVLTEQDVDEELPDKRPRLADTAARCPVDLDLDLVLGKMPQKIYSMARKARHLAPALWSDIEFMDALDRVLRLPAVASKRFLTNKVDRSVTGLVAQQQCVGPLHTPLADVAVTSLSHFTTRGTATAIGEQPVKMLVNEQAGARMAVGEALTNLVFASVSNIRDIKCSANWMWPAKLPGEGARLYSACEAMCTVMGELGIAVDGGKDSLSMAAAVGESIVKSPGSLVISVYAPCDDVTLTVSPDLKCPIDDRSGWLIYVPMSKCSPGLGGSALGQCFKQLGEKSPDLDDSALFIRAWNATQKLVRKGLMSSGHDVSDGGLITSVLEMAFAGNRGLDLSITSEYSALECLFSERLGLVIETSNKELVLEEYRSSEVEVFVIGQSLAERKISLTFNGQVLMTQQSTNSLRDVWESTSFALERLQCNDVCVTQEREWLMECDKDPCYSMTFDILPMTCADIKVAVIREEGSNGDREMAAALLMAGFQPWDVTMQDLVEGRTTLDGFRGVVFVGGFSYADVFGSAKGWAACCSYNEKVSKQLEHFKKRPDTFSLGVCNGCQLMALLGWIGENNSNETGDKPSRSRLFLAPNSSNRFESRFASVKILDSPAIMFRGMQESVLGVWLAHGEGKFQFEDKKLLDDVTGGGYAPLRFVDHDGHVTQRYPLNPNGSPEGIAGLCSKDGRHLAVMPHPERCVLSWQFPWKPSTWKSEHSPWLRMFQNALVWCQETA